MKAVAGEKKGVERAAEMYEARAQRAMELQAAGRRIMGYVCIYPPVEIMTAFGFVPYRILGDWREPVTEGERVLTRVVCPFLRSILDLGIKGRYGFLDGVIGAHTCDIGSTAIHIWRDNIKKPDFVHFIDIPHTAHEPAREFFASQLRLLIRNLESFTGSPLTNGALERAAAMHNRQRSLVRQVYELRKASPPPISASENLMVLRAVSSLPVEEGNALLEEVLDEARRRPLPPPGKRPRLLVWGSIIDDVFLLDAIESAGADVVMDDTCVGTRAFWADVREGPDPVEELSRRYLLDVRCPRTYREAQGGGLRKDYRADLEERFGYVGEFARGWGVDGVVLQSILYCDTHAYEIPHVRDYLDGTGIPHVYIEHDYSEGSRAQVKNRAEAFVEMLRFR